jgi:hypothetical protein
VVQIILNSNILNPNVANLNALILDL